MHYPGHDGGAFAGGNPLITTCDLKAHHKTFQIPFPWTRVRLIKIIDVEDEPALWGPEYPKIGEVRVPAQLDRNSRIGGVLQIGCHHSGSATKEGKLRRDHAPVSDRDELRDPGQRLLCEQCDRIAMSGIYS